jgi:hypothetical protein
MVELTATITITHKLIPSDNGSLTLARSASQRGLI